MVGVPLTLAELFDGCRPVLAMIENPPDELRDWALAVAAELVVDRVGPAVSCASCPPAASRAPARRGGHVAWPAWLRRSNGRIPCDA
jgi:hypothetical protein